MSSEGYKEPGLHPFLRVVPERHVPCLDTWAIWFRLVFRVGPHNPWMEPTASESHGFWPTVAFPGPDPARLSYRRGRKHARFSQKAYGGISTGEVVGDDSSGLAGRERRFDRFEHLGGPQVTDAYLLVEPGLGFGV